MRKFLTLLAGLCLSVPLFAISVAPSYYTTVAAQQIVDASGAPLKSGTAYFTPTDQSGAAMSVRVGGGGQMLVRPAQAQVVNGAMSITLADVSLTAPSSFCYHLSIVDNGNRKTPVLDIPCLQPTGAFFSIDNYSANTSAIYPQAGDTVQGDLGVNGNMNVTGNLNVGGFTPQNILTSTLTTGTLTSKISNGVLNPTQFPGADIGAQVNAAFATCTSSTCKVMVPAGNYSYATSILLPNTATTTLELSAGATLTYTGNACAIQTANGPGYGPGSYQGHYFIRGGHLIGTSTAKCGVLLAGGVNSTKVSEMAIDGFIAGDGILDVGTNAATIEDNKITGNLVGLHLAASPGYASNNVLAKRNVLGGNGAWGIINGDMSIWTSAWQYAGGSVASTGVASPNYGNLFLANDLEANGAGAAIEGLTVGSVYTGNYVEANPRGIVVGMTEQALTAAQQTFLYGRSAENGGSARDTNVNGNYFTTAPNIHSLVELRAASTLIAAGNSTDGSSSACFFDLYVGSNPWIGQNDNANVNAVLCQGGGPGWSLTDTLPTGLNLGGALNAAGAITANGNISSTGQFTLNSAAAPGNGGVGPLLGNLGAIAIFSTPSAPSGACTSAGLDIGTWGMAVCTSGTWVIK